MKQNVVKIVLGLFIMVTGQVVTQPGEMTAAKKTAAKWGDKNSKSIQKASKTVWDYAEIALKEHKSAKLLSGLLEEAGFKVERGVSDMPSAFVAEYGKGKPIVAFLAEYDACQVFPKRSRHLLIQLWKVPEDTVVAIPCLAPEPSVVRWH